MSTFGRWTGHLGTFAGGKMSTAAVSSYNVSNRDQGPRKYREGAGTGQLSAPM